MSKVSYCRHKNKFLKLSLSLNKFKCATYDTTYAGTLKLCSYTIISLCCCYIYRVEAVAYFIGVRKSASPRDQWQYTDDSGFLQFSRWRDDLVPTALSLDCAGVKLTGSEWSMFPAGCDGQYGSVCQFEKCESFMTLYLVKQQFFCGWCARRYGKHRILVKAYVGVMFFDVFFLILEPC